MKPIWKRDAYREFISSQRTNLDRDTTTIVVFLAAHLPDVSSQPIQRAAKMIREAWENPLRAARRMYVSYRNGETIRAWEVANVFRTIRAYRAECRRSRAAARPDTLPHAPSKGWQINYTTPPMPSASAFVEIHQPAERRPAVVLVTPTEKPLIRGVKQPHPLTPAQANVIMALLQAWPHGLRKDELPKRSGQPDAVNILKKIKAFSQEWDAAIELPGSRGRGRGYRIADW